MALMTSTYPSIQLHGNPVVSLNLLLSPSTFSFPWYRSRFMFDSRSFDLKNGNQHARFRNSRSSYGAGVLRKPVVWPAMNDDEKESRGWVDWEDRILEDTVPLVGFMRMVLHSGKYECGDRLSPEHERIILDRLLPYHPESEKKIGCGVDYIKIGYHPNFGNSRCLFIVQKDGVEVDFSYWKCIKGLIRKKYPLYAESFILRHFRHRRRID